MDKKTLQKSTNKTFVIHPFLFAIFPILFLFSQNVGSVFPHEIIFPLLLVILVTILIWISLSFLLKSKTKSGFITSLGLITFFSYGHIYILLDSLQKDVDFSHIILLIPIFIFLGLGLYYFIKTKRSLNNATKIVNVVAISIIMISFVSIGEYFFTENPYQEILSEGSKVSSIEPTSVGNFPDVYYIILDAYAGSKSLQMTLNYDNSEFIDFLTKKGFYVASESISNYQRTSFSVPSTLNMKYLNYLVDKKGENSTDINELVLMSRNNQVFQNFKSKGYTIFAIEAGSIETRSMMQADFRLCGPITYTASDFSMMLIRTSILNPIHVELFSGDQRDIVLCGFTELAKMAERDDTPKFVFAHLMIPHNPFIFGANGEPINPKFLTLDDKQTTWDQNSYLGQLKFANKKIQEVIEKLTKTDNPPVIIIQSDHGMRGPSPPDRYERYLVLFNNFKAYYFPGKERNMEFETTTPVNSFRVFFNLYFDDKYELLEDKIYLNYRKSPWKIRDVTHILIKDNESDFTSILNSNLKNDSTRFLEILGDPVTSGLVTYQVVVSGQISLGPNANPSEILSPDGTTIDGTILPTGLDDYHFTGNIVSITADQHIFSFVDGVEVQND